MKGQAELRGQGETRIQINQSSWEIPAAPRVTPGPAERDGEERSSFPHPLQVAAAHPSKGRGINCSHQSVSPGEGKRLGKTSWEWEIGEEEFMGKEEFREWRGGGGGVYCVHNHRERWRLGVAHLDFISKN